MGTKLEFFRSYGKGKSVKSGVGSTIQDLAKEIGLTKKGKDTFILNYKKKHYPEDYMIFEEDIYFDKKKNKYIADKRDLLYDNPILNGTKYSIGGTIYFKKILKND